MFICYDVEYNMEREDFCVYVNTADAFLYTKFYLSVQCALQPHHPLPQIFFHPASAIAQVYPKHNFVGSPPKKLDSYFHLTPLTLHSRKHFPSHKVHLARHHLIYIADVPCPLRCR